MAGRIPEKFIDDLLARIDIVDVIDARVPLKKAGKDYKACCPFHEEKTPSFTVSADKQFYHCFGCGEHGTAIGFLMRYDRMSFPEAVRELASIAGMPVPEEAGTSTGEGERRQADLLELLKQANQYYQRQLREHPQAAEAVDYLKGRGLSGEIAASFGLGYAPAGWDNLLKALGRDEPTREALTEAGLLARRDNGGYYDRFRQRVMFPIEDYRGRVVGFGGRVLGEGEPKYLNSPETPVFHKGREVYGLHRARDAIRREQRVLVVEGYMDVVALAQFGIDYVVATLGTAATRDHLERLFRYAPEVVFAFDGDRAGRDAAWRALNTVLPIMGEGRQVSFLFLPEGEDPDSLVRKEGSEAFGARIRGGSPLDEYLLDTLAAQVDLNRTDGRARLVELARPLVDRLPAGIFRDLVRERLGEKARVNQKNLSTLLGNPPTTTSKRERAPRPPARGIGQQSLMRQAISLLVQHPRLAAEVSEREAIASLQQAGADLLQRLLTYLDERGPETTTAQILNHFRDSKDAGPLGKLAATGESLLADEERDLKGEFQDLIRRLRLQDMEAQIEALEQRDRDPGLTPEEVQELNRLHKQKQGLANG
jgi:DNA primase